MECVTGLVDTHTHVFFDDFNEDRDEVFARAQEAGVKCFVNVGINTSTSRQALELATARADCVSSVGYHPHYADAFTLQDVRDLEAMALAPQVVAVGEIGLDFFKNHSSRESQMRVLKELLDLASRVNLPVIFHCRDAHQELLKILTEQKGSGIRGVIHCFTGTQREADQYLELGFYLSFAGQITFRNAQELAQVAAGVPLSRILIETDAPYLSPEPRRGRRNEPAHVQYIAARQAELHHVTPDEVARVTTQNARALFGTALPCAGGGQK